MADESNWKDCGASSSTSVHCRRCRAKLSAPPDARDIGEHAAHLRRDHHLLRRLLGGHGERSLLGGLRDHHLRRVAPTDATVGRFGVEEFADGALISHVARLPLAGPSARAARKFSQRTDIVDREERYQRLPTKESRRSKALIQWTNMRRRGHKRPAGTSRPSIEGA